MNRDVNQALNRDVNRELDRDVNQDVYQELNRDVDRNVNQELNRDVSQDVLDCVEYLRGIPAYRRLMESMLEKYRRYGRPAGTVCLRDATEAECDAARRIFGRPFAPPLRFQTEQFEKALQASRFHPPSLKDVLEAYFQTEIKTNRQRRCERDGSFSDLLQEALGAAESAAVRGWLEGLTEKHGGGYMLLRRAAAEDWHAARAALRHACRGADLLEQGPQGPVRLAVLSARAAADPHALDANRLGGKLLLHLLAERQQQAYPESAERRDDLCYQNGILCDSISSCVAQTGLALGTAEGEHPAYRLFRQRHEGCTLSLSALSLLAWASSPSGRVYVVENEMVYAQLCDQAERFHSPLVCTSGQPSVAAQRLLAMLAASGAALYYSGDFDGRGLLIAARLAARYPQALHLWHMSPEDYARCCSGVRLSSASLKLLRACAGTPLQAAADAVGSRQLAGYQELLISELGADLTAAP